ncbi:MAG: helix-turn-helix transcriptional regulator [Deltaproteobacteria bacterium]|nr:helix-turn-helix transcriptional regulator [Deltaproteobacteria bacterium]MBW2413955.1 helix-turn-helix transcriptional regulator [Deltaproteobacteria bacterium]
MEWSEVGELPCSIARSLAVVGDRWTLLILREVFSGVTRFDAFRSRLGISRNVLADRLHRLVGEGILEMRPYQEAPRRHAYELTEAGADLYPVLLSLMAWGDRWRAGPEGPPIRLVHRCGAHVRPAPTCEECGEPLRAGEVRALAGPGLLSPRRRRAQKPS